MKQHPSDVPEGCPMTTLELRDREGIDFRQKGKCCPLFGFEVLPSLILGECLFELLAFPVRGSFRESSQ